VLQGRPIKVEVTYNSNKARRTNLRDSVTGEVLIVAQTEINTAVPPQIMQELADAKLGIGEILTKHQIETRREILRIGYEPKLKAFYREYDIIVGGKVWFRIMESFDQLLYA
jgi:chorismate-pyruvate lyase